MGVRISDDSHVTFYCSTSGIAFGPVFAKQSEAEDFLSWVTPRAGDPRDLTEGDLAELYVRWQEITRNEPEYRGLMRATAATNHENGSDL